MLHARNAMLDPCHAVHAKRLIWLADCAVIADLSTSDDGAVASAPAGGGVASSSAVLTEVGRYRLDALLARGGMGEVYLARMTGAHGFARPVVVKIIRTELLADERAALMFVDEARIAAGLHHRNIVQILDFDRFEDGAFLVTEYVEGCDLRALLH